MYRQPCHSLQSSNPLTLDPTSQPRLLSRKHIRSAARPSAAESIDYQHFFHNKCCSPFSLGDSGSCHQPSQTDRIHFLLTITPDISHKLLEMHVPQACGTCLNSNHIKNSTCLRVIIFKNNMRLKIDITKQSWITSIDY